MSARPVLGAALALAAAPALAQDGPWRVEGVVASEYVSKGVGRSDGEPHVALQAQRRIGQAAYAGVWTGSLRSPLGANAESQLYVGWTPKAAGWSFDVRPMYKVLSGARASADADQWELRVDASRTFGRSRLRLRMEHVPDGYGPAEASTWVEAALSRSLGEAWTVQGAVGRREQEVGRDYTAWNVGLRRRLGDAATAELRWIDTDQKDAGREYDGRFVGVLTLAF